MSTPKEMRSAEPLIKRVGECWEWTGSKTMNGEGYGEYFSRGEKVRMHRLSYQVFNGPIPDGLFVLHKCDNKKCCNPSHLFVGTHRDNMIDAGKKGLTGMQKHPESRPWGDKNWTRKYPEKVLRGRKHGSSKITEKDVLMLPDLLNKHHRFEVCAMLGISYRTLRDAVTRKTWKHVPRN